MDSNNKLPLTERLANVSEMLISFASTPVLSHYFQTLADFTRFTMNYDLLAIALVDPTESAYIIHMLDTKLEGIEETVGIEEINKGAIGGAIVSGRLARRSESDHDESDSNFDQLCRQHGLNNQMIIPLVQAGQKIGALLFAAGSTTIYEDEDERVGVLLASGLSANFEMARLYQTLADERSMFASMLESTQDGFIVVDPNFVVQLTNPAFNNMLHIEERIEGESLSDVFFNHPFAQLFTDDEQTELELKLDDGRIVQAVQHRVVSEFGDHLGWAAALHDITLLKELVSMKTDFVNTVSHDLKNPIASIRMAADLIPRLGETNSAQQDMHQRIVRASEFMKELVTELLDIGQLESNLGLNIQPFDLGQQLGDVLFALQTSAEDKQITVTADFVDPLTVEGDSGRLRQLFLNLIGNAIKYTPDHGQVWVSSALTEAKDQVEVTIRDNGLGIPADDLPHIFDKFYRVRTEDRANIKGTGLGLAITKSVVDAHHGTIQAQSEVGKGTTFTILLPLTQSSSH